MLIPQSLLLFVLSFSSLLFMPSGRNTGSFSCDLHPVYGCLAWGEGEVGEKDLSLGLFLQLELLGVGEEGGRGEHGVDLEAAF